MTPEDISNDRPREAALVLPGMSLNGSIFPVLDRQTLAIDFCDTVEPPSSMEAYAEQLDRRWQALAPSTATRWVVVGHSFGGMLAMQWLLDHPASRRRVDGLVLIATTAGRTFDRIGLRLGHVGTRDVRLPLGRLMSIWNAAWVTRTVKLVLAGNRTRRVDFAQLRRATDLAVDLAGWRNTTWQAMHGFRTAIEQFDVRDRLSTLDTPTIVLHGDRDSLMPLSVARELGSLLSNSELRTIRGAAHLLPLTHGHEVRRAVEDLSR